MYDIWFVVIGVVGSIDMGLGNVVDGGGAGDCGDGGRG